VNSWSATKVQGWLQTQALPDTVLAEFDGTSGSDLIVLTVDDLKAAGAGGLKAAALWRKIQAAAGEAAVDGDGSKEKKKSKKDKKESKKKKSSK
jgi:hypothetical protein